MLLCHVCSLPAFAVRSFDGAAAGDRFFVHGASRSKSGGVVVRGCLLEVQPQVLLWSAESFELCKPDAGRRAALEELVTGCHRENGSASGRSMFSDSSISSRSRSRSRSRGL